MTRIIAISRDPFARRDVVRETVAKRDRKPCAWCGSRPGRFRYGAHADGICTRPELSRRAYCCADCARSDS